MVISNPNSWIEPGDFKGPKYDKIVEMIAELNTPTSTPGDHASEHENGGGDEISVAGLSGELADNQPPKNHKASHEIAGGDLVNHNNLTNYVSGRHKLESEMSLASLGTRDHASLSDAPIDAHHQEDHASRHQNGGGDEISVLGLSGLLADSQTPLTHASTHLLGGSDPVNHVQPSARVYRNSNQTINYAVWTNLVFNSERWDNDTIHSTSSNTDRLTCKTAGVYSIFATAGFEAIVSPPGDYHMILRLNGSTILSQKVFPNCVGLHAVGMDLGSQYNLAVNDYVTVEVYWWCSGCSGTKNILYTAEYSPEFMMTRLGAV